MKAISSSIIVLAAAVVCCGAFTAENDAFDFGVIAALILAVIGLGGWFFSWKREP